MDMKLSSNVPIKRKLMIKAAEKRIPLNGTFELTPLCNMNCKMCYVRMSKEELDLKGTMLTKEQWIELGQQCKNAGTLFLLLTGGEVFAHPDFKEIYTNLAKMGFIISINTNGTLIDEKAIEWLMEYPPSRVNVTMYGANNETYKKLCGNDKGYDQAVKAVELLSKANILVNINFSATKQNIDDMKNIYEFARERKLTVTAATYMFPPIRNNKVMDENTRLTAKQAGDALLNSKKYSMSADEFQRFAQKVSIEHAVRLEELDECGRGNDEHMGCMAGKSSFWITWDGKMTGCGMMPEPKSFPLQVEFTKCFKDIGEEIDKIFMPTECTNCEKRHACMVCGAIVNAENITTKQNKPQYLCEMTEIYLDILGKNTFIN